MWTIGYFPMWAIVRLPWDSSEIDSYAIWIARKGDPEDLGDPGLLRYASGQLYRRRHAACHRRTPNSLTWRPAIEHGEYRALKRKLKQIMLLRKEAMQEKRDVFPKEA